MTNEITTDQTNRAEILLGYRTRDSSGDSLGAAAPQYTFDLYIDKKSVTSPKISYAGIPWYSFNHSNWSSNSPHLRNCLEACTDIATEFAKILSQKEVTGYDLFNGQRMRHTTRERVSCEKLPEEAIQRFRKTLDAKLEEKK